MDGILQKFRKNKFLYRGGPLLILVVGGSLMLKEFTNVRYKYSSTTKVTRKEMEEMGLQFKPEIPLETVYEEVQKNVDIDNWVQKRGPRPWEENFNVAKE